MASDSERGSGPRLIALLKLIAERGQAFSLSDLAERAALPSSTVHRLLKTLVEAGMIERGERQSYLPGRELFRMAALLRAQFDLIETSRPFLKRLWSEWDETSVLCIYNPSRRNASVVEVMHTTHPLRYAMETGIDLGLVWGSLGKAILAQLSEDVIDAVIADPGTGPLSGRHNPPPAEVRDELEGIRRVGYAIYDERRFDISGVAAAIFGRNHSVIGSIGLTMPSQRFASRDRARMATAVRLAAQELSSLIALKI
ncbi:IclR family transcriptional regulator [soil metagenome]